MDLPTPPLPVTITSRLSRRFAHGSTAKDRSAHARTAAAIVHVATTRGGKPLQRANSRERMGLFSRGGRSDQRHGGLGSSPPTATATCLSRPSPFLTSRSRRRRPSSRRRLPLRPTPWRPRRSTPRWRRSNTQVRATSSPSAPGVPAQGVRMPEHHRERARGEGRQRAGAGAGNRRRPPRQPRSSSRTTPRRSGSPPSEAMGPDRRDYPRRRRRSTPTASRPAAPR